MGGLVLVDSVRGARRWVGATTPAHPSDLGEGATSLLGALFVPLSLAYPTVGALIASRRPKNPIAWILCAVGLVLGIQTLSAAYASYALLARSDALAGAQYTAWLASWVAIPVVTMATVSLMLLFPEGRLPSGMLLPEGRLPARSWQIVVWMAACGSALLALWIATQPGQLEALGPGLWFHAPVDNPLAARGAIGEVISFLGRLGWFLLCVAGLFAGVSLISRRVLARGEERQQLKWFTYAAALMILGPPATMMVGLPIVILLGLYPPLYSIGIFVGIFGFLFFPIAVGIGILRHRLYDIDLIINRTLVYGALTALLALVYCGGVVLMQGISSVILQVPFRALVGQETQLGTVIATLAMAALFSPLRRRIQALVDRRFYRRKYDARKILESFSTKLRDETDLDSLKGDLVGVVRETMQPAHVSLWLRSDTVTKKATQRG